MRSTEQIESDIRTVRGLFEANRHRLEALHIEHLFAVTKAFWPACSALLPTTSSSPRLPAVAGERRYQGSP